MMFCKECGLSIDDDSRFCRQCGAAQLGQHNTQTAQTAATALGAPAGSPKPRGFTRGTIIGLCVAGVLFLLWVGSLGSSPTASTTENYELAASNLDAASGSKALMPVEPEAATENWTYSTDQDKVRGAITHLARTTSTNSISQSSPYDSATTMDMTVRKSPAFGTDVVLVISSGQMMCPSYQGCSGTVRFDNAPAERINFKGPADNSSDTIFVEGAKGFIAKLKRSKKVIIEKTLYNAGDPQFEFNTTGLKWDH